MADLTAYRDAIERERRRVGMSRTALARAAGLSGPGLAKALRPGGNPTLATLVRLAGAVGCDVSLALVTPPVLGAQSFTRGSAAPSGCADDLELYLAA